MAKTLDNISIKNKIIFGLLLTLFISLGIGILEYNRIVKIQNNFETQKIFNSYKSNFIKLQNLYYRLEVSIVKLAHATSKDVLIREQNEYKNIDIEIRSILDNFEISSVSNDNFTKSQRELFKDFNDTITKYKTNYLDQIYLSSKKLDEYVTLTFHPDQVADNYQTLIAEQQKIGNIYSYDYQQKSKDEIVWELLSTYEKAISDLEKFTTSTLGAKENSINKIVISIDEVIFTEKDYFEDLKRANTQISIIVLVISILFVFLLSFLISESIVRPLFYTNEVINNLSKGKVSDKIEIDRIDEIGLIYESLNELILYLNNATKFSKEMSIGNFSFKFNTAGDNDVLGSSLIELKDSLIFAKNEEKRREIEDARRRRTAEGIAKFSDILRQNQNNIKKLAREVISNLVKFLKANQGVIFNLVDDEDVPYLKLLSAYAWNREKFLEKNIEIGEGLIGSVAHEKFTVYMTDVPEDYIEIKSGTGSANPKSILIVPLKVEDEVLGVLEIASFKEFEQYEIKLVEMIAENIASTLKSVRITAQTSELLEKFQIQAAEMKEQEQAMKQTIESLRDSEDKMKNKEEQLLMNIREAKELNKQIKFKDEQLKTEIERLSVENKQKIIQLEIQQKQSKDILEAMFTGVVIIKKGGIIEFVNKATEEIFGYSDIQLIGIDIEKIINKPADIKDKKLCEYLYENLADIKKSKGKEFFIKTSSGKLVKTLLEIMILEAEKEEDKRMVIFVRDIDRFEKRDDNKKDFINKLIVNDFENTMKIEYYEDYLKQNNIEIPEYKIDDNELIKWGPTFELGISLIDGQHKRWIKFINDLYIGLKQEHNDETLNKTFKKLMDYTDYHFGFEEKYMGEFGYENKDKHHITHEKFVNDLNQMFVDYVDGNSDTVYNLVMYLKKWVVEHVTVTDRKYVELFRKHGLK